ncbi:MAG: hypothetical protein Q8Q35_02330, partial [Nanoarchaeota archaeon]|nr:hypothetical protein [Nanoarchaeota archaeon]
LRTPPTPKPAPVSPMLNTMQFGGQPGSVPTTEFNEGGTHEENPLGGIPQGMNPNGAPNLVEEGELKIKDPRNDEAFIISPKIKLDKTTAEEFDLEKKYIGKDMVKIFEKILRKDSKRDGDTIEEHSKQLEIAPYIDAHKVLSERKNAEEAAKEEAAFTLDMDNMMEKYPERMQSFTQPQQPQSPSPEEQMMIQQQQDASQEMPTQEQPIMTHGGNIYQGGAGMPQQQMPPQQEQGGGIEEQVAQTLQQGADPQEVIGQLVQSGMSEEQAMQLIQGIMQQLQRQSQEAPVPFVYGGNIYQTGNYAPVDYNYWKQQSEPQVTIPERMVEDANPITVSRDPNLILEDPSKENVTSTTKTNVVEDEEYGPKTFEFESPIQSYLKYAPVAYNLAQGLFGKEDKRKVSDYYNPVSAPIQDISHQIAAMERQHAGYAKGIKQGSGQGGYKSNMLAANLALQDRIGQAFEGKGNKDAQAKMQADLFNAAAKTQAAITKDQFNAMSKAQKQAYLDTALTQLGQIGDTAERNELGLTYANMMSPDYQLTKKDLFDLTKDEK